MKLYEEHFQKRGIHQFTIDGAINREVWDKQQIKILFYLKENYGYQDGGIMNISDYASIWLADGIKTYKQITHLAEALYQAIEKKRILPPEEIDNLSKTADFQESLQKIALVNIKKHSGLSQSDDSEVREESYSNAHLLRRQIEELSPTVILAGGTVCWHSLVYDLELNKTALHAPKESIIFVNEILLLHANHPASRSKNQFDIHKLHKAIFEHLK